MTRQQQITLQQVRCKVDEAYRRIERYIKCCADSTSEEMYETNMTLLLQATSDYQTWKKVLNSLIQL